MVAFISRSPGRLQVVAATCCFREGRMWYRYSGEGREKLDLSCAHWTVLTITCWKSLS